MSFLQRNPLRTVHVIGKRMKQRSFAVFLCVGLTRFFAFLI